MKKKIDEVKEPAEGEVAVEEKQVKKGRKVANIIINVILVIAIIIAAISTYISFVSTSGNGVPSIFGLQLLSIQTESMYPTLEPGDLVIDKSIDDTSTLRVNDIITYWTVIDGERVLNTHRITNIYDGGSYLIFETKGDNNTSADPLTVHESEVVGVFSRYNAETGEDNGTRLKGVGKVFDFLQTSTGFLVVVVVPVALFFLFHLVQFFRVLFEYQSVKNRLRYEQERGKAEDALDEEKREFEKAKAAEREKLEAELREKLKAELIGANAVKADEPPAEEAPTEEPKAKTEEEIRAELEAKIRAEYEAKMASEAPKAEEAEDDKTTE
ncbi:MAG: signal peptidase I [Clostridia bacterium]|nr:signal peptidase I [Clostridia bacterium]